MGDLYLYKKSQHPRCYKWFTHRNPILNSLPSPSHLALRLYNHTPQRTNVTTDSLNMASRRGIHDPFNTILLRHRKSTAIPDRLLTVHTATYAYSRFTHHL